MILYKFKSALQSRYTMHNTNVKKFKSTVYGYMVILTKSEFLQLKILMSVLLLLLGSNNLTKLLFQLH